MVSPLQEMECVFGASSWFSGRRIDWLPASILHWLFQLPVAIGILFCWRHFPDSPTRRNVCWGQSNTRGAVRTNVRVILSVEFPSQPGSFEVTSSPTLRVSIAFAPSGVSTVVPATKQDGRRAPPSAVATARVSAASNSASNSGARNGSATAAAIIKAIPV